MVCVVPVRKVRVPKEFPTVGVPAGNAATQATAAARIVKTLKESILKMRANCRLDIYIL